jgi:hypothetical protein
LNESWTLVSDNEGYGYVGSCEIRTVRKKHQVTGAESQAASMGQQVADRKFVRNIRVVDR